LNLSSARARDSKIEIFSNDYVTAERQKPPRSRPRYRRPRYRRPRYRRHRTAAADPLDFSLRLV